MVGMLQIVTYLLCVYLVFKGIEIYQIAKMSTSDARPAGLQLGKAMIVVSLLAAVAFFALINYQAESVTSSLPKLP